MRHMLAVVVGAVLLLTPTIGRASTIELLQDFDTQLLVFGTAPATGDFQFVDVRVDGELIFLDGPYGSGIAGVAEFFSGALLSLTLDTDLFGQANYAYADGQFTLNASWTTPDGTILSGSFAAPLLGLTINTRGEDDDTEPYARGEFTALLGPGLFDPLLASVLGVLPQTLGGSLSGDLDLITGDPSSAQRLAGAPGPWDARIEATAVPEPGVLALSLLSVAALGVRHRLRTRRT
jgi:hypothetical protein